jgi:HAD superfamily hydrolase (TIGR01509 family)
VRDVAISGGADGISAGDGPAYKLVIFDCDGVLVDSEPLALRVDAMLFAELGWPLSEAEIARRFVGRTSEYMLGELAAHIGRPVPAEVEERFNARYREVLAAELQPVEGIVDALDQITTPSCVASSGSHAKMRFTLGLTGLYERFEGRIFSASEVAHGKPAPDLFLHAAARLGIEPADCAVVEDSQYGVEAARAAGMTVFGYAGGVTPASRLEGPGTVLFTDMRTLPELLGQ